MRFLLLTQDYPPTALGGVAAWAADLAAALHEGGEAVVVLARSQPGVAAADAASPWPVIRMAGRSWGRWQGLWSLLAAGPRLARGDVLIAATWELAAWLAPLREALGVRLLVAAHGSDLTRLAAAPPALRRVDAAVTGWVPVSGFLGQELRRLGLRGPVTVMPMPLDLGRPDPAPRGAHLLVVSRLIEGKGVERVIALGRALGRPVEVIGDGPLRGPLEAVGGARLLGAQSRAEARAAMGRAAAVALLPRLRADGRGGEGLGLCLIEAAAAGTPVIGCMTGGVAEAVGPGLLLDDPDQPDLAAVERFLGAPGAGALARAWVEAHHGPAAAVAALRVALA